MFLQVLYLGSQFPGGKRHFMLYNFTAVIEEKHDACILNHKMEIRPYGNVLILEFEMQLAEMS